MNPIGGVHFSAHIANTFFWGKTLKICFKPASDQFTGPSTNFNYFRSICWSFPFKKKNSALSFLFRKVSESLIKENRAKTHKIDFGRLCLPNASSERNNEVIFGFPGQFYFGKQIFREAQCFQRPEEARERKSSRNVKSVNFGGPPNFDRVSRPDCLT